MRRAAEAALELQELMSISQREIVQKYGHLKHIASPAALAHRLSGGRWQWQPHLKLLSRVLAAAAFGKYRRLLVEWPPQHGKSELCSHWFPVWYLALFAKRIILASYGTDFAETWGRQVRNTINENRQALGMSISEDSSAAGHWETSNGGSMVATGMEGQISGRGADLFIVDDPIKDFKQASSKAYLQGFWDWFRSVAVTRLQPNGIILFIMTRWAPDDPAGRIRKELLPLEKWVCIRLPALAEENDLLKRRPGEALWPERFNETELEARKAVLGSHFFAGLYQQRPSPIEGGLIKREWFRYYSELPRNLDRYAQSWDMTFKDAKTGSFVAGLVWGKRGGDFYLLPDREYGKLDFPATIRAVRSLTSRWPQATAKLVEDAANGPAVIATLKREITGLIPIAARGSKDARLAAVSPMFEAANVWFPSPQLCPWIGDLVEELCGTAANDDMRDASVQALQHFAEKPPVIMAAPTGVGGGSSYWRDVDARV